MPRLSVNTKNHDSLVILVYEMLSMSTDELEMLTQLEKYLNEDTSKVVKIIPYLSDKRCLKCIYPVIPNEDVLNLVEKISETEGELAQIAKGILRTIKIMKIKG